MSVKIYDGLMIERDLSLGEARLLCKKARDVLEEQVEREQLKWLSLKAAFFADKAVMGGNQGADPKKSPWAMAMGDMSEERKRNSKGENVTAFPMDFEASFMSSGNGRTLMIGFGLRTMKEAFAKELGAVEYGYWDNTDEPEDISEEQWAQREADWRGALGARFELSPAEAGMSVKLVSEKYAKWWEPTDEQVAVALGSDELRPQARARELSRSSAFDQFGRVMLADKPQWRDDPDFIGIFMELDSDFRKWAKADGSEYVKKIESLMGAMLPSWSVEQLKRPIEDLVKSCAPISLAIKEHLELDQMPLCEKKPVKRPGL